MSDTTVTAFVLRNFNDAGTQESFVVGDTPEMSEGVFGNYKAAGLVRKATEEDLTPVAPPAVPVPARPKPKAKP